MFSSTPQIPLFSTQRIANIKQDKHSKQLANKLAARLPRVENERQWADVAFTLAQLQHKDEEIQKLVQEGFKVVQAAA